MKYKKLNKRKVKSKAERDEEIRADFAGFIDAGNSVGDVYVELSEQYGLSYSRIRQICQYKGKVTRNA